MYHVAVDAGEELEYHYIVVHLVVGYEGLLLVGVVYLYIVVVDIDTYMSQQRIVGRNKSIEELRTHLACTVASHEGSVEENTYLGNARIALLVAVGCNFNGCDEVLFTIGAQHTYRKL